MWRFFVVLLSLSVLCSAIDFEASHAVDKSALRLVHMLFRHGDRTPVRPYPNDPYKEASSWPVSWGQLTNRGKDRHFRLGQFNRERYSGFLSDDYIPEQVYVRSTDVDRTLMSAESHLAGLFPPSENQTWNGDLPWQPIPVHTMQKEDDLLLVLESKCPRYFELVDQANAAPEVKKMMEDNKEMVDYLSEHSGVNITVMDDIEYLYDTLFIETQNNKTLPDWTLKYFPQPMKQFNDYSFKMKAYNKEMQKLRGGPLVKEVVEHMTNYTDASSRKLYMYSAHDVTVATFLSALDVFDNVQPPYASLVLVELYEFQANNFTVKLLYKNVSDDGEQPHVLQLPGCSKLCPLERFVELTKNVTDLDIRAECGLLPPPAPEAFDYMFVIECLASLCGLLMLALIVGCSCWYGRVRSSNGYAYTSIQTTA